MHTSDTDKGEKPALLPLGVLCELERNVNGSRSVGRTGCVKHSTVVIRCGTHLSIAKLDSGEIEWVGGMSSGETHAHVHIVAAGSKRSFED